MVWMERSGRGVRHPSSVEPLDAADATVTADPSDSPAHRSEPSRPAPPPLDPWSGRDRRPGDGGFAAFYTEQYGRMVQLAYLTTGSRELAEELVQDAFVGLHPRWSTVREPAAYLRRSVMNGWRDLTRRRARYRAREPRLAEPSATTDAPDELWDALGRLTPRQRAAIVLRFWGGLSEQEVADALGVRPGTVKSLLHRGIDALRQEIER
jgi:RNA polymerase sigma-70 factor (sigma-E family)